MAQTSYINVVAIDCLEPDKEEQFNRWYDEVHLPEVMKRYGCLSAKRYRCVADSGTAPRYLAIYELPGPDAVKSIKESLAKMKPGPSRGSTSGVKTEIKFLAPYERIK